MFSLISLEKFPPMRRTRTIEDYDRAADNFSVRQFVCIEAAASKDKSEREFLRLNSLSVEDTRFAGIVAHADLSRTARVRLIRPDRGKCEAQRYSLRAQSGLRKNPKVCLDRSLTKGKMQVIARFSIHPGRTG